MLEKVQKNRQMEVESAVAIMSVTKRFDIKNQYFSDEITALVEV